MDLELQWLPDDAESDFQLFVRVWRGQLGVRHLIFPHGDLWVTVRVTRASLPQRLDRGPYHSTVTGNA